MSTIIRVWFSLVLACACCILTKAQKRPIAGLNINSNLYSGAIRLSLGLTLETHLSKHSGLENGIFYRTEKYQGMVILTDSLGFSTYTFIVSQRFINVPLLYKYYSKTLNFSVGPLFDFYIGWKQRTPKSQLLVNSFDVYPTLKVGLIGKVSKTFALSQKTILEPEIRIGFLRTSNKFGAGVGITGKYQL